MTFEKIKIISRKSLRNPRHDYSMSCWYMITINTLGREPFFGELATTDNCPSLRSSIMGDFALKCWKDIPNHYPQVVLDDFVFMPDHLHGLMKFTPGEGFAESRMQFGIQSRNLSSVVRAFKSTVKRYANENQIAFGWQKGYHDRIIYTEEALNNCRNYIQKNLII